LQTRGAADALVSHEQRHGPAPAVGSLVGAPLVSAVALELAGTGLLIGGDEPAHATSVGAAVLVSSASLRAKARNFGRDRSIPEEDMLDCMRPLVATLLFAIASGCALDRAGTAGDEELFDADGIETTLFAETSSGEDSTAIDSGAEQVDAVAPDTRDSAASDTSDTSTCNESACGALPTSATKRVALVDRTIACPAGFKATDIVEAKGEGDGCVCGCSSAPPACPGYGSIATYYSSGAGCGSTGATLYSVGTSVCSTTGTGGVVLANNFKATAPAPVGGACGGKPSTDGSAVARPRRICEPNAGTCAAPICGTPFLECIEVTGACPAPFNNPRTIGTNVVVSGCPACTCSLSGATCTGTISFSGTACTGTATTLPVDGSCVAVPSGTGTFTNFKYTPNAVMGATCTPSYTTAPGTRTFISQRNLCCR
jgi:hypothetical protein